ncbi:hypothetical protein PG997_003446 [Apiospora hydei]|uniref:Nudix hydrolase domain-containing protein n=1 Tax=Apiospora hydei TaxID=1337664 RepID=A0ABR1WZC6_9PEZI
MSSTESTPTKPEPKATDASDEEPDAYDDDNIIEVRSDAYRTQVLYIRSSYEQSVSAFKLPIPIFELLNPMTRKPLEVSAIVFNAQRDKVLLLQRLHVPNSWEVPSCSIFEGEKSALHAVVRMVHLCSGQVVRNIVRCAGFYEYESVPSWPPARRYCFVVEVDHPEEEEVPLWLQIYQSYAWLTPRTWTTRSTAVTERPSISTRLSCGGFSRRLSALREESSNRDNSTSMSKSKSTSTSKKDNTNRNKRRWTSMKKKERCLLTVFEL